MNCADCLSALLTVGVLSYVAGAVSMAVFAVVRHYAMRRDPDERGPK